LLCEPPVPLGRKWIEHVNRPQRAAEVAAIAESLRRGRPYGSPEWQQKVAGQLGLEYTFRDRGRPRKPRPVEDESLKRFASPFLDAEAL
jgi:hypothetical protein